jgi:uncharacterized Fe-S radical SAM superfamily protein PflX
MIKNLVITKTKRTPEIIFKTSGELIIKGRSLPEDVINFYKPVLNWLEEFNLEAPEKITLTIDFAYLSTSTARITLEALRIITSFENTKTTIIWMYEEEDADMREQGEILQSSIKKPFEFLEKQATFAN